ncbi:peptidoglycan-binding protein [Xylanimonas allomyrinae]|uniref:Peptidoglycan-binding protein n=1 Tax=Xylanimonas allomyrinae TaxID=2509459 RepID=A0A4P6EJI9_9MICO|nr:peptidoglycan-binding protein [Xylanimonas allomyrinae]QAY62800.1 peptidoglycan-binding protein [Xylanimonas allomyrinae]
MRVVGLVVAAALLIGGGWALAQQMVSPDQVAARAEPPAPVPVVAPLREGYLHGAVTMSVTAGQSGVHDVVAPATLTGVVTASDLVPGASVTAGASLARVNGRPVIVLTGSFPLYRDLVAGDSGDDVRMLQQALIDAGLLTGRADGVLGARTLTAVRQLYKHVGFTAPTAASSPTADTGSARGGNTPGDGATPPAPPSTQTSVDAAELVFTPTLPATVTSVLAVGTPVETGKPVATLAAGATQLTADLPPESIGSLAAGATGTFTDADGKAGTAVLMSLTSGADGQMRVLWAPTGAVEPGTTYVLSIENPAAQADKMLLAPVAAVVSRGGADAVQLRDGATFREVQVKVVGVEGAVAAVQPVGDEPTLKAGVEVRLG